MERNKIQERNVSYYKMSMEELTTIFYKHAGTLENMNIQWSIYSTISVVVVFVYFILS